MPNEISSQTSPDQGPASGKLVLVFGATGQQGGAVATALLARGWPVRAFVRDPEGAKAAALVRAGAELAQGDLSDPASVRRAMTGSYGVFSVQPSSGQGPVYGVTDADEIRYGKTIADLVLELGIRHLIYSSVGTGGKGPTGMGHFESKAEIEHHIRSLDIPSTIIRPSTFMELLMLPGMGLDRGTFTFFMRPDAPFQVIAVEDVGRVAASIFEDPKRYIGQSLDIAGDAITGEDLQEKLTRAAGRLITYQRFPDALLTENPVVGGIARLFEDGRLSGSADIEGLRRAFGGLSTFDTFLEGPGKPLLKAALSTTEAPIALR